MKTSLALDVLRIVLGLVIGAYSLLLVLDQFRSHAQHALVLLGLAELFAAIMLLIPPTIRVGGITLLIVFFVAALFHLLHGDYNIAHLAVYAAADLAVLSNPDRLPGAPRT